MTLAAAFRQQGAACAGLGSPFMAQLCALLAADWPGDTGFGALCADWPGDLGPSGASLPLRIAGGLHALVLSGRDPALAAHYPPATVADAPLRDALFAAMARHKDFLTRWVQSAPQTNEVRRAAAVIAAAQWLAARHPMPFICSELGASAGLNLMWDRYALEIGNERFGPSEPALSLRPGWTGALPPRSTPRVTERRGVDLNPLNPGAAEDVLRLSAYLWPDQPERLALTRAAIAAQAAPVDRGDAVEWLAARLEWCRDAHLHLIYHTVAWQYFDPAAQAHGTALIEAAGAQAGAEAPLAWLAMEADGGGRGAGLTLRLWPGDLRLDLGRVDFHGRWIDWRAPASAAT